MKKKLLFLDDDRSAQHYMVESLKLFYDYQVDWPEKLDDVVSMVERNNYDIVILDIMMPIPADWTDEEKEQAEAGESSGLVLFKKIRKARPNLPILIYSARACDIVDRKYDYIRKPENIQTITDKLNELLK